MKKDDIKKSVNIFENFINKQIVEETPVEEYSMSSVVKHTPDEDLKQELKTIHDEMAILDQHMKHVDLNAIHDMPNFSDFYRKYHEVHDKIMILNGYITIVLDKYPFRK